MPWRAGRVTVARMTPAKRRYLLRVTAAMAVYIVSIFAADYLIESRMVAGPLALGLALLPGLAMVAFFWAIGMYVLELEDEFMRMLLSRQMMIATGFTLSAASIWGMLEQFTFVGHLDAYMWVVVWAVGMLIGGVSNRITHGTFGDCW